MQQERTKVLNPNNIHTETFCYKQKPYYSPEDNKYIALDIDLETGNNAMPDISEVETLLGAVALVLSRYTAQNEVIIDSWGVFKSHFEDVTSLKINVAPDATVTQYLGRINNAQSEQYVTNIYFGTSLKYVEDRSYDLSVVFVSSDEIKLIYRAAYFEDDFIHRMGGHLKQTLKAFTRPGILIGQVDILTEEERKTIEGFNPQPKKYPIASVVELFEAQVLRTPHNAATEYDGQVLTYMELNTEANKLCHYLTNTYKIGIGSVVGIMANRSARFIISVLAVLKSGGTYLPIDPAAPSERKKLIIDESDIALLITESTYIPDIEFFQGNLFALDIQLDGLPPVEANPPLLALAGDLAYIIFTSGSTGKPKGVMIKHDSLVNLCYWHNKQFSVTQESKATLYANVSFDAAVWEMWPYLLSGACLYPLSDNQKVDLKGLASFLKEKDITHCFLPTPICEEWSRQKITLPDHMTILTGGDRLRGEVGDMNIINNYGPTESTVVATSIALAGNDHAPLLPIGKPVDNTRIYILDDDLRRVPVGVVGQIFIAGKSLAKGYHKNPDLTRERFIANHFNDSSEVMYMTGDKGCWLNDGNIMFAGRDDNQVKIRGYRIELGEVENIIIQHPEVSDAKVVVKEELNGNKILLGFYIAPSDLETAAMEEFLKSKLPDYMIPTKLIRVKQFNLTSNGKIDIDSLMSYDEAQQSGEKQEQLTGTQKQMVSIWQEVLNAPQVSLTDNFFSLGGDSIKAIRLIFDVNNAYGVSLELMDVFKYDTPLLLLKQIESGNTDDKSTLLQEVTSYMDELKEEYLNAVPEREAIEDVYPIADIQMGMIYHGLHDEEGVVYHDQIVHQVKYVDFDPDLLRETLVLMAAKHEILRTRFDLESGSIPVQVVYKTMNPDYLHQDFSQLEKDVQEKTINEFILNDRRNPFKVDQPGLWRIRTFALGNDVIVLALICHHAIIDGWSDATFSTELNNIYRKLKSNEALQVPMLGCSYKDYVREELIAKRDPKTTDFWKHEFNGFHKTRFTFALNDEGSDNKVQNIDLGASLKQQLVTFAAKNNVSPRIACFSVYLHVIKSLALDEEVTVGLHTHNRPLHKDSDQMLGCFLNSIPVRYHCSVGTTWENHLKAVNEKVMQLSEHNKLSLMEIVKMHPQVQQDNNGNTFFDSLFAFLDFHVYKNLEAQGEDFTDTFERQDVDVQGQGVNNTFFNFIVNSTLNEFNLLIFYKSTHIDTAMVKYMGELFKSSLCTLISNSGLPLEANVIREDKPTSPSADIEYNF